MDDSEANDSSNIEAEMGRCKSEFHQLLNDFELAKYLKFKRDYPEFDITHGPFKNMEELFDVSDELMEFGLDPLMLASVMDGDENAIELFCVELLDKIKIRRKLENEDISHIQSRRKAIPDSLLNFLIILIVESCQLHEIHPTYSMVVLIVETLGGLNVERRKRVEIKKRKREIAELLGAFPHVTNRQLEQATGIDFTTLSRWRKEKEFISYVKIYRGIYEDAEFGDPINKSFGDLNEALEFVNLIPANPCNLDYINVIWRFRKPSE